MGECVELDLVVDQRCAELGLTDFEDITRLRTNAVCKRQCRRPEEVDVHIPRTQELTVLEMVVFEVFQAVAHVRFATEKLVLPQHFAITQDTTGACKVLG